MPALVSASPLSRPRRPARLAFTTLSCLLLSACATMQDIPAGTAYADVQARHGRPTVECPQADGSRMVVWSTQPMGHNAWATRVTAYGTIGKVEQVLTDEAFRRVRVGVWDTDRLQCQFGPPADISQVGMPSVRQTVWSYRYMQSGVWYSLMYIYVSDDGVVQRMHPGPDPLFETREWPFIY